MSGTDTDMQEVFSSVAVTEGVRVEARSLFDPHRSRPESGQWFFVYTISITNEGPITIQLLSRHWIIRDEAGGLEEVRGPGVVGEQPVLVPGGTFEYTSGCPLTTATGTMEGTYQMVNEEGEAFEVRIAPFVLSEPFVVN